MSDERGKVVVGISSSLAGLAALRFAIAEARRRDTTLLAVRAWSCNGSARARPMWEWERMLSEAARRTIAEAFHEAAGQIPADLTVLRRTAEGTPAMTLKDSVGSSSDLLVIGAGRRWLGSGVVRGCADSAGCPVVVVPRPELARAGGRRAVRRMLREATSSLEDNPSSIAR